MKEFQQCRIKLFEETHDGNIDPEKSETVKNSIVNQNFEVAVVPFNAMTVRTRVLHHDKDIHVDQRTPMSSNATEDPWKIKEDINGE